MEGTWTIEETNDIYHLTVWLRNKLWDLLTKGKITVRVKITVEEN